MAHFHNYMALLFFIVSFNLLEAARVTKPQSLILPIGKDGVTNQYYTEIDMGTPKSSIHVVLHLGGDLTWFDCENGGYTSSSYKPIECGSKRCIEAKGVGCMGCNMPYRPGCTNNTCGMGSDNPLMDVTTAVGLGEDVMGEVYQTNGRFYLQSSSIPHYQFSCAHTSSLLGLANGTKGLVGLAKTSTSLHKQLSSARKLPHKFALCMPPSNDRGFGDIFIGGGPYFVPPYANDVSKELMTTPLLTTSYTPGFPSDEYFIGVKSIKIDNEAVAIDAGLLTFNQQGHGGTKLSTMAPYTVLERSIYKAVLNEFAKKAVLKRMKKVVNVAPFGLCYKSTSVRTTMTGPDVPVIDLVLQSESMHWRIYGANSMVKVNEATMCLGLVDGGLNPRASIVLGGHQLEDNLVEFDLVSGKLGFSSSLLVKNTTCSQRRIF